MDNASVRNSASCEAASSSRLGNQSLGSTQPGNDDNWKRLDQVAWNVLKKAAKGEPIE